MRRLKSLVAFIAIPCLGVLSALLALPAITATLGAAGFASVAIAQSFGIATAVVCELGWSVVGPQRVARLRTDIAGISQTYESSVATKLMALTIAAPVAAALTAFAVSDYVPEAMAISAATAITALSPAWLLTGLNQPGWILLTEVIPRVVLTALAALWILNSGSLASLAVAAAVPTLLSAAATAARIDAHLIPRRSAFSDGFDVMRAQLPITLGRSVSVLYTSAMPALVGLTAAPSVAVFAAADRLLRMGLNVVSAVPNRLQSWVGVSDPRHRPGRSRASLAINAAVGVLAAGVYILVAGPASQLLFSGTISFTPELIWLGGASALVICLSRGAGLSLIAKERANWVAGAHIASAVCGLALLWLMVPTLGAVGAMATVLGAETCALAVQSVGLLSSRWPGAPPRPHG